MAAACLKNEDQLPLRLMFQDEARFGRMSDPRSCWAPAPHRPVVNLALVREFRYEYAAVSPWDGGLDFMTAEKMNTGNMSRFLDQVSKAHQDQFIVMVVDGASSHKSKELEIPKNVSFIRLPPYSPELNPAEQIQDKAALSGFYEIIGIVNAILYALKTDDLTEGIGTKKMIEL